MIGLTAGLIAGALCSATWQSNVLAFPGIIAAILLGFLMSSGDMRPGGMLVLYSGNLAFYGLLGMLVSVLAGWTAGANVRDDPVVPECCICGLRWPKPTSARCPKCGNESFRMYAGRKTVTSCPNCQYDLTGNMTGVCTECGHAI